MAQANVGLLSVVEPKLPGHTYFAAHLPGTVNLVREFGAAGNYCSGEIRAGAKRLIARDLCAVVAADSVSAIALIEERRGAQGARRNTPIVLSVPGNPGLDAVVGTELRVYRPHKIPESEPLSLSWFTHDLLRESGRLGSGENVIVLVKNNENPGSNREVQDTVDWFDNAYHGRTDRVTISVIGVSCRDPLRGEELETIRTVPGLPAVPASANAYNLAHATNEITAMPNIKGFMVIGDPTANLYRDYFLDIAKNVLQVPIGVESFPALTKAGNICWAGNRQEAWEKVTEIVLWLCAGGLEPSRDDPMTFALFGNAEAARELNIPFDQIKTLCDVPIEWLEPPIRPQSQFAPPPAAFPKPPRLI